MTGRQISKIRGVEHKMLQRMIGCRRRLDEAFDDFMQRWNAKIRDAKLLHGFLDSDRHYWRSVFSWGGHVARLAQYDCQRSTHRVLNHKSWEWVQRAASANRGNQCHCREVRVFRWERVFYLHFKRHSWQLEAQDKYIWTKHIDAMVEKRARA